MNFPVITPEDIQSLATLAPDLNFSDSERQAVLLECGSKDISAAPGSGKTTLLAAKLLLLAKKWPHHRRGICVLSHTNVAREEIERRLAATPEGARLLTYPHFIGTIHGFVNHFLALPYMRSIGKGVDIIDDETFSLRAVGLARMKPTLKFWMGRDEGVKPMIEGLILKFNGIELEVASEGGRLPNLNAPSHPLLLSIKHELSKLGVYRFADMFAYAEQLLAIYPDITHRLSRRFPMVFIDEMQDTDWAQEHLLSRLFNSSVKIQRYGDAHQRILLTDVDAKKLTFPKPDALTIRTSKRFGPAIATAVSAVQLGENPTPIVGERTDTHAPLLLVYSTDQVKNVIEHFGNHVLDRFDDDALCVPQRVKALCSRKSTSATVSEGRHLPDYWPSYSSQTTSRSSRPQQFWTLMACPTDETRSRATLAERAADLRRALLLVLRAAKSPAVSELRDAQHLFRHLGTNGHDTTKLKLLIRELALENSLGSTTADRQVIPVRLFESLHELLPHGMTKSQFDALPVFAEPQGGSPTLVEQTVCTVNRSGRSLDINIGTVHSMKGETHLATLVLESHGGRSKKVDLQEALPIIAGLAAVSKKTPQTLAGQF